MKIDRTRNRILGLAGETCACIYLERRGFDILSRNLKLRNAEIDILARDGRTFVLAEVKTLRFRSGREQTPALHYTEEQRKRQLRAAKELMNKYHDPEFPVRHDVVEVIMGRLFPVEIRHHINIYRMRPLETKRYE